MALCHPQALELQIRDFGRVSEWYDLWGDEIECWYQGYDSLQVTRNAYPVTLINYWCNY